ncbi:molybdopterin-containing oxidoreductase family protein [Candidatus Solirubrobacter pratensis]|uniref:molybdopterin-containing oxidoreductase family protein n=1 Tax=Candidatus Solirubrobacter pratensis TaxID=1298857 RepID=UPI000428A50D|nr:molybdopterin oxidoreductase family protein [Candidatus Solirubrobacter pratensis]
MDVHGACPLDCPDTCSWIVTVEDGRATRMRGNRDHPFTRGALCAKVNHYLEHTQAADRLLHPLRRVGRKGEGRFERISWDEALHEIAERLLAVRDEYGGEAIWPFQGTGTLGYIQGLEGRAGQRLWNVLGASHHDMTICSIAGGVGARYTNGTNTGMDPETFAHSKLILLWGTNTLTSGHHLWKFINAAKKDGAHLVAIDPLRTRTADQAHEHLAPLPGTDTALALGLLHVVLDEGAEDREYLAERTLGWEEFRERILEFPPDRVAAITGLPQERIVELGRRLAHTRPTGIRATMGIQRHAGGGMALRTLNAIPGVTGDWRYPGGGVSYSTSGYFGGDRAALWRDDLRPGPVRSLAHTNIAANLLDVDDPPIKALVIYGANPLSSNPGSAGVRKGLEREDLFTVVMEQFPTDTVDYADIVLPATMQTEHLDLHEGYGHMYLLLNQPAVEPPGEALSTTETFRRLARAMGLQDPSLYDSDEQLIRTLLGSGHPSLEGITYERLQAEGWVRLNYATPFVPFADGFPTPSGKLELVSEKAAADGYGRLPGYTPPAEAATPSKEYPLALLAPASHWFLNSTFANHPGLQARAGGPRIELHPDDAVTRGLQTGDEARVYNGRGEFVAAVEVSDRVRPGVVASTKGHWLKHVRGGANANATVPERDSDMGRGAVFHDNGVQVEAVPAAVATARRSAAQLEDL